MCKSVNYVSSCGSMINISHTTAYFMFSNNCLFQSWDNYFFGVSKQRTNQANQHSLKSALTSSFCFSLSRPYLSIWYLNMHLDRGLQAAVGIVLAFSMLWTVAILIPDKIVPTRSYGLTNDKSSGYIVHEQYPRILKNTVSCTWYSFVCILLMLISMSTHR